MQIIKALGDSLMILTLAAALANVLNFIIFAMIATWYVAPWLSARQRAEALAPLLSRRAPTCIEFMSQM